MPRVGASTNKDDSALFTADNKLLVRITLQMHVGKSSPRLTVLDRSFQTKYYDSFSARVRGPASIA